VRQHNNEGLTASRVVLAVVGVAFVVELAIMAGLQKFGTPTDPAAALLNAALLAVLIAAPVYWLVQRPLQSQYAKRREAERLGADMTQLALTDALTRIPNRRGITAALLDAMAQADRYNTPLSVAMGDIDHFKRINDTHGHEAGDKVLAHLAAIMSESLRMPDKVGRYGGEEFLIVFPHTTLAQARKIAERIRAAVADTSFDLNGKRAQVTLSLGVTQFQRGEDLEQLLVRVDKALYQAKEAGRNQVAAQKPSRRRGE